MTKVMTVQQVVVRAKQDGYPISEFTLRRWLRRGEIPYRMAGKKILIYYPHFVSYITCMTCADKDSDRW